MNWSMFQTHGSAPTDAFEAFSCHLFELWCRAEYGDRLIGVNFVRGAGGDGGVEAYGTLITGDIVGLQAKWFLPPGSMGEGQFRQIKDSFETAIGVRPRLVKYMVALPRRLSDRKRGRGKTERNRWDEFCAESRAGHANVEIDLWDEVRLERLLADLASQGLQAYWFQSSIITMTSLRRNFAMASESWLKPIYVPDLHTLGEIQRNLNHHLATPAARAEMLSKIQKQTHVLGLAGSAIGRLGYYPEITQALPGWEDLQANLRSTVETLSDSLSKSEEWLRLGGLVPPNVSPCDVNWESLKDLMNTLDDLDRKTLVGLTFRELKAEIHPLQGVYDACTSLDQALDELGSIVAFVGEPGTGKTHGLADAVRGRLEGNAPAVILRGYDVDPSQSWAAILSRGLDLPSWPVDKILEALEATASRTDVLRARNDEHHDGVEVEPTRVLIAIDGLDESVPIARWHDRLGELPALLRHYPRIQVSVTLRTSVDGVVLGAARSLETKRVYLPSNGDVPVKELVDAYCHHYHVGYSDSPLLWWILRDPLSLRLFCEEFRGQTVGTLTDDVSLSGLLMRKFERLEREFKQTVGGAWPEGTGVVLRAMWSIAQKCVLTGEKLAQHDAIDAVRAAQQPSDLLTADHGMRLLDLAVSYGILERTRAVSVGLTPPTLHYAPAFNVLTDFLLADRFVDQYWPQISTGGAPDLPVILAQRTDTLTMAVILMARRGHRLIESRLWANELSQEMLERLQLRAISTLRPLEAESYRNWVAEQFRRSMPSCRKVVSELILPVARDEAHPFTPRFIHEILGPLDVASRDLFWSGPADLPPNGGGPWEGRGDLVWENLGLDARDPYWSFPLAVAWRFTTVDNKEGRRMRRELAQWGSENLPALLDLLILTAGTNDDQMREDLLMSTYGAVYMAPSDSDFAPLADWLHEYFLQDGAQFHTNNIVIRQAIRGTIERIAVCTPGMRPEILKRVQRHQVARDALLPINAVAARTSDPHHGYGPIDDDLAWYVVPGALRPFFSRYAVADRRDARNKKSARRRLRQSLLLQRHARQIKERKLTPEQFAFGMVYAYVQGVGWNPEEFVGEPNGGQPGEKLGADIAIMRRHGPASHGARSNVGTFAEKYTWIATHILRGYLADRLPVISEESKWVDPPVDLALVSDSPPNPVSDIRLTDCSSPAPLWPSNLVPTVPLTAETLAERSHEWIRIAPDVVIEPWLKISGQALGVWAGDYEWLMVSGFVVAREAQSHAESVLWVSALVVDDHGASHIFEQGSDKIDAGHWSEWRASIGGEGYPDPTEAAWAWWIPEYYGTTTYSSRDRQEGVTHWKFDVSATSADVLWESPDGEHTLWLPAFWLRQALGVFAWDRGQLYNKEGEVVAVYGEVGPDGTIPAIKSEQFLLVRRDHFEQALPADRRVLWAIRSLREPAPGLSTGSMVDQREEKNWLAIMQNDGITLKLLP